MTFVEKLEQLCRERGLSERGLAAKLSISQSTISLWRIRNGRPRPETAKRLADFFQVSVGELLDDTRPIAVSSAEQLEADQQSDRQVLRMLPSGARKLATTHHLARTHYLRMEALIELLVKERAGGLQTEEKEDLRRLIRAFHARKARERKAMMEALKLAEDVAFSLCELYKRPVTPVQK